MEDQKAIDAKLVDLERRSQLLLKEIRELKTQRNTHAQISKLPNEVLLETFMVMMISLPVDKWHQVAHVCRRWRNVAVGGTHVMDESTDVPTPPHNAHAGALEEYGPEYPSVR
jgi:hypothetical protein